MRNPFEKPVEKGLVPRELKKIRAGSERVKWTEEDVRDDLRIPIWNVHDTSLKELFEGGHIAEEESFEGLGVTGEDVTSWIAAQHALGKKIATLDVMGQTRAGLEARADRVHGWSLADVRRHGAKPGSKEDVTEGDVFKTGPRREVLKKLDDEKTSDGTELGVVFFRPVAGVKNIWGSKYGQLYLYEFVLRPLYERLTEGGMIFMSSMYLAGMPLLEDILHNSTGFELVANEKKNAYMLRKTKNESRLPSISDLSEEARSDLDREFTVLREEGKDARIAEIKSDVWRFVRRTLRNAEKTIKATGQQKKS